MQAPTGKTQPAFLLCEDAAGDEVALIAKLSGRAERGITALAMEGLVACLAGDLGLPIPKPYIVDLSPEWIDAVAVANPTWAAIARQSSPHAFGSRRLADGYATWRDCGGLIGQLGDMAALVLVFDAIAKNADRRPENPNCLRLGDQVRIIDHELCFPEFLLGLGDAWATGGLQTMATPGWHIFRDGLHGKSVEWAPAVEKWKSLTDQMIDDYRGALPTAWSSADPAILRAIDRIKQARDNIDACVAEVQRMLKC